MQKTSVLMNGGGAAFELLAFGFCSGGWMRFSILMTVLPKSSSLVSSDAYESGVSASLRSTMVGRLPRSVTLP
jgi:hypothetical protein